MKSPNFWLRERLERRGVGDALPGLQGRHGSRTPPPASCRRRSAPRRSPIDPPGSLGSPRPGSRPAGTDSGRGSARRAPSIPRYHASDGGRPGAVLPSFQSLRRVRGGRSRIPTMIVFHIAVTPADDYVAKREPHRRDHIARLQGLRANGILLGGGPSPDGQASTSSTASSSRSRSSTRWRKTPTGWAGAWTRYETRSFTQFVEPWEMVPVVLDGSRTVTLVEGPVAEHDMAQFALIEMRGAGRLHLGGFFEDGQTLGPDEDGRRGRGPALVRRDRLLEAGRAHRAPLPARALTGRLHARRHGTRSSTTCADRHRTRLSIGIIHERRLRDRAGGAGCGPRRAGVVGPPSPVRSSKSCDSGEWVTEPARRGPHPATGPARLTHVNNAS